MLRIHRTHPDNPGVHECYYIGTERRLNNDEVAKAVRLLAEYGYQTTPHDQLPKEAKCVEIGPRLSIETPFSTAAVDIFRAVGIPAERIEVSKRYEIDSDADHDAERARLIAECMDPMLQEVYAQPLSVFGPAPNPEPVRTIPVIAFQKANERLGLGMDAWDLGYYSDLFTRLRRDPTDVEMFQAGNGNSEHSRHWFWRGHQKIDGILMPHSLMDLVKQPLAALSKRRLGGSLVAFHDNAGVQRGHKTTLIMPVTPGTVSGFRRVRLQTHITSTAETHNHPSTKAPFPGAETGAGGCIRDKRAVGRGSYAHVGGAGYAVGNLGPRIGIPGEYDRGFEPRSHASPLSILIKGSNGVSDYGNKIGEPLIGGFCRSFGQMVDGKLREWLKCVLYCSGMGRVLDMHHKKHDAKIGMLIVAIGGPAYRIGVGGGSASSMTQGSQSDELDLKSVQRGNAEMENRVNRVITACCELRGKNPIVSIHDQGAGGPSNVLTELMDPLGGEVNIRKIQVADKSMSVLEIWVAEYQERYGLLIKPKDLARFQQICTRERASCEVVGSITGSGRIVLTDDFGFVKKPVDLPLKDILGDLPKKTFSSTTRIKDLRPLTLPKNLTLEEAARIVLRQLAVGSKAFLTNKVDRHVTGLVARQQNCGPTQIPVSDYAITADGYFDISGAVKAYGEQPIKMLINARAGARMTVVEALTNLAGAVVSNMSDIECRGNWMWAAKKPNEGAEIYSAALGMRDAMIELQIALNGGKDSLSMATLENGRESIAPGMLVIKAVAPMRDIRVHATADFKGGGSIGYVHLGSKRGVERRLGGSALAQALCQLGDESPDIASMKYVVACFKAVQECIAKGWIRAYHDVSDGGLFTTLTEMCLAGHQGAIVNFPEKSDPLTELFHEEAGMVFEFHRSHMNQIHRCFSKHGGRFTTIGHTRTEAKALIIEHAKHQVFHKTLWVLRSMWEKTSTLLEEQQANPETVWQEARSHLLHKPFAHYSVPYKPSAARRAASRHARVAILREEGVNGDREMTAAFMWAGCDPIDVTMEDLKGADERVFDEFRGLVYPGGFSYGDVLGSGKGWAAPVLFDPRMRAMFDRFYDRKDTFSLGVCNGFQFMSHIGVLPKRGLPETSMPRLVHNESARFESRWVTAAVSESPAVLLQGMAGLRMGVWVAHGEGQLVFPDEAVREYVRANRLAPISFVDPDGKPTASYPFNPNGSDDGWTALVSECGRHFGWMPHAERCFLSWQCPWLPEDLRRHLVSPWLKMFQNARAFCESH